MALYSMDQLEGKSLEELQAIAGELNTPNKQSKEKQTLVYDILDKQAELQSAQKPAGKKRGRPKGSTKQKEEKKIEDIIDLPKRKRGRPSKADIEAREKAIMAAKEQLKVQDLPFPEATKKDDEKPAEAPKHKEEVPDFISQQMKKETPKDVSESVLDYNEIKKQLNEAKTTAAKAEDAPAKSPAKRLKTPKQDFIIVKDVPHVYSEPLYAETLTPETQQRPKFRRFKDDPLVQPGISSSLSAPVAPAPTAVVTPAASAKAASQAAQAEQELLDGRGVLEIMPDGIGFLRSSDYNYLTSPDDIYVAANMIRAYGLKPGDVVEGKVRVPRDGEKYFLLTSIERINGLDPKTVRDRVAFEFLTPLFPDEKFNLCTGNNDKLSCRVVDIFSPIGKGQRALIVAQPKTGKTWLMKDIANAIAKNHPDTYLMMLLIDERPEEVTDMARTVNAEVIASTFDEPAAHHVKIANIVLEKAKRLVECGHDVVIFLDSITRLARAFNTVSPASGKVLTGGVDANSLQHPKRFFGAARNIEGGGSLTIIATALIDTGSKMDEVIFEEFKGTGNMELQLDRNLANKRIYPSVNLVASSTRRDDLLLTQMEQNRMIVLRNFIADMNPVEAMTEVGKLMKNTRNNEEFLITMNR